MVIRRQKSFNFLYNFLEQLYIITLHKQCQQANQHSFVFVVVLTINDKNRQKNTNILTNSVLLQQNKKSTGIPVLLVNVKVYSAEVNSPSIA